MRGEIGDVVLPEELSDGAGLSAEKQQEQQLMNKLAASGKLPARPASAFLQKKLQQRKFFDSGDYAMDKDKKGATAQRGPNPMAALPPRGGPQPAVAVPPLQASPQAAAANSPMVTSPGATSPGGATGSNEGDASLLIPRPETVPQRKASIIQPMVHCKLSPQPHVQHHDVQSTPNME